MESILVAMLCSGNELIGLLLVPRIACFRGYDTHELATCCYEILHNFSESKVSGANETRLEFCELKCLKAPKSTGVDWCQT